MISEETRNKMNGTFKEGLDARRIATQFKKGHAYFGRRT